MIKKGRTDNISCIRCGVCCSSGVCPHGKEDSYGLCIYLIIGKERTGQTSCRLLFENKINPKDIGIGAGCILRQLDMAYDYYRSEMKKKLEDRRKKSIIK